MNDLERMAKVLYQLSMDMDYADYSESRDAILSDLTCALQEIKGKADANENEYWRTFAICLGLISDGVEINENIFK